MKENFYKIEKPKTKESTLENLLKSWGDDALKALAGKADEPYLHWEKLKNKTWLPDDKEGFWSLVKFMRQLKSVPTAINDQSGSPYTMGISRYAKFLHLVDMEMAGNFMGVHHFSELNKRQFIARSIMEESIASSRLEGANTSRAAAKKMLLEGRDPKNYSETMIVNNHKTMQRIESELKNEPLSWELISELHRMITQGTLPPEKQGHLRNTLDESGNKLVIKPWDDFVITYEAPPKEFVEAELPKLIDFANDESTGEFIHPIIKAIMIHFWIGLLHPFEDGNGRLARILFYWYVLRKNYWAFAYLSLSEKIVKSPKQYAEAYVYSEQEDFDLTYFIDYNVRKIEDARSDFQAFLNRKIKENDGMTQLIKKYNGFNERQLKLLQYLHRNSQKYTSIQEHVNIYKIARMTAINDLKFLVGREYLFKIRKGKNIYYYPTEKIAILFKDN